MPGQMQRSADQHARIRDCRRFLQRRSDRAHGPRIEPLLLNFVFLLIDKNRMENFRDIGEEFARLVEQEQGVMRARVTTAVALPADLEDALRGKLASLTGKTMILEKRVDPAVIGGVKVVMEDKILDGTVRTNLDLLRKTLEKAAVR